MSTTMSTAWEASNTEPALDDVLHDPIVRLLMQGDHTGESEVRQLIERVRKSLPALDPALNDEKSTVPAPTRKAKKTKRSGKTRAA